MLATLALSSVVKVARLSPRAPGRILGAAPGLYSRPSLSVMVSGAVKDPESVKDKRLISPQLHLFMIQ